MNNLKKRMVDRVIGITGMNNMMTETVDSVERATREAHTSNFFKRDLKTVLVKFDACDPIEDGERVFSLPERVRRVVSVVARRRGSPSLLKLYHNLAQYYAPSKGEMAACEVNGSLLLRGLTPSDGIILSYLVYPNVSDVGYDSWIAEDYESVIVYAAAARVLADVNDATAKAQLQFAVDARAQLHRDAEVFSV